jgi:hypothetical protein
VEKADFNMSDAAVQRGDQEQQAVAPGGSRQGTLSIKTNPSPLAVIVNDHKMNTVARGVSPFQTSLTPGIYLVTATLAGYPDITKLVWVVAGSERSVELTTAEPTRIDNATSVVSALWDKYINHLEPLQLPPPEAQLNIDTQPFFLRFRMLKDWNTAEAVDPPRCDAKFLRGRAILEIVNPQRQIVFVQVACARGKSAEILNVAIPPAGVARASRCQLVIAATSASVDAYVRLSTNSANAALQYMARGYVEEAKQMVSSTSGAVATGLLTRAIQRIVTRFDDPAAALVPRYVALRTREATLLNTVGESMLDVFQDRIGDGPIIEAELAAREGMFGVAATHLLRLREGAMPLFTEGFSLLSHRLNEVVNYDMETIPSERRPTHEQYTGLKKLWSILTKWAPYVNLNCPTITFPGNDIAAPTSGEDEVLLSPDLGWIEGPKVPPPGQQP